MNKFLIAFFNVWTSWYMIALSLAWLSLMSFLGGVAEGGWFWLWILLGLAIFEGISYLRTKKTLSQRWRAMRLDESKKGYYFATATGWLLLFATYSGHIFMQIKGG